MQALRQAHTAPETKRERSQHKILQNTISKGSPQSNTTTDVRLPVALKAVHNHSPYLIKPEVRSWLHFVLLQLFLLSQSVNPCCCLVNNPPVISSPSLLILTRSICHYNEIKLSSVSTPSLLPSSLNTFSILKIFLNLLSSSKCPNLLSRHNNCHFSSFLPSVVLWTSPFLSTPFTLSTLQLPSLFHCSLILVLLPLSHPLIPTGPVLCPSWANLLPDSWSWQPGGRNNQPSHTLQVLSYCPHDKFLSTM